MSKEQGYNGWANYETWLVKLWIDNDQSTHSYFETEKTFFEGQPHAFAEFIATYHEDIQPDANGVFADLLNAALSKVNWHEIAESILGDAE